MLTHLNVKAQDTISSENYHKEVYGISDIEKDTNQTINNTYSFAKTQRYNNHISIGIGIDAGYWKDIIFSPMNYNKTGWRIGVEYRYNNPSDTYVIAAQASFGMGNLTNRSVIEFDSRYYSADLSIEYLRKIWHCSNDRLSVYLGGQYQTQAQFALWNSVNDSFSYFATHGFNIKSLGRYQINNKHSLTTSISIPVIQLLARSPYNGVDDYLYYNQNTPWRIFFNGDMVTVDRYFGLTWQLDYSYNISPMICARIAYILEYRHISHTHSFTNIDNRFFLSFIYKF